MKNNKNVYALVTGGTRGVGRHLGELLAEEGYSLVMIARNAGDLEDFSREIKSRFSVEVLVIEADLSNSEDAFIIHRDIKNQNLNIAILANSVAGQGNSKEFLQTDLQKDVEIVQFNIVNFVVLAKLFLPEMIKRRSGKVISVAAAEKIDDPLTPVYLASVAFLDSFMSNIRLELEGTGISVTNIRSQVSAENVFGEEEKPLFKKNDRPRLVNKTHSDRDGYDSFMRGD